MQRLGAKAPIAVGNIDLPTPVSAKIPKSGSHGTDFLAAAYPPDAELIRRDHATGSADLAASDLLKRLVASDSDILIILDSDMIVARNFIHAALPLFAQTSGLMSLFNTPTHPISETRGPLVRKASVGATGMMLSRALGGQICERVSPGPLWDFRLCDHMHTSGVPLWVVADSLVQHLGFSAGQNSRHFSGDLGRRFVDDDARNAHLFLEELAMNCKAAFTRMQQDIDLLQAYHRREMSLSAKGNRLISAMTFRRFWRHREHVLLGRAGQRAAGAD